MPFELTRSTKLGSFLAFFGNRLLCRLRSLRSVTAHAEFVIFTNGYISDTRSVHGPKLFGPARHDPCIGLWKLYVTQDTYIVTTKH